MVPATGFESVVSSAYLEGPRTRALPDDVYYYTILPANPQFSPPGFLPIYPRPAQPPSSST